VKDHGIHWSLADEDEIVRTTAINSDLLAIGLVHGILRFLNRDSGADLDFFDQLDELMEKTPYMVKLLKDENRNLYKFGLSVLQELENGEWLDWRPWLKPVIESFLVVTRRPMGPYQPMTTLHHLMDGLDRYYWNWFTTGNRTQMPCYEGLEMAIEQMYETADVKAYLNGSNWLMSENLEAEIGMPMFVMGHGTMTPMGVVTEKMISRAEESGIMLPTDGHKIEGFMNHDLQSCIQRSHTYCGMSTLVVLDKNKNLWQRPRYWGEFDARTGQSRDRS